LLSVCRLGCSARQDVRLVCSCNCLQLPNVRLIDIDQKPASVQTKPVDAGQLRVCDEMPQAARRKRDDSPPPSERGRSRTLVNDSPESIRQSDASRSPHRKRYGQGSETKHSPSATPPNKRPALNRARVKGPRASAARPLPRRARLLQPSVAGTRLQQDNQHPQTRHQAPRQHGGLLCSRIWSRHSGCKHLMTLERQVVVLRPCPAALVQEARPPQLVGAWGSV
jgi:hypothetical protein